MATAIYDEVGPYDAELVQYNFPPASSAMYDGSVYGSPVYDSTRPYDGMIVPAMYYGNGLPYDNPSLYDTTPQA